MSMLHFLRPRLWVWLLSLVLLSGLAQAQEAQEAVEVTAEGQRFSFKYQDIDDAAFPDGIQAFIPVAIRNSRAVYGMAVDADNHPHPAFLKAGQPLTVLPVRGDVMDVNENGTMAGAVLIDPTRGITRAALFYGSRVRLIPRLPGEINSAALALNDDGAVIVASFNAEFGRTIYLFKNGKFTELPGLSAPSGCCYSFDSGLRLNRDGILAGALTYTEAGGSGDVFRGYRYNTATRRLYLLELPGNTRPLSDTRAGDINEQGRIAGEIRLVGRDGFPGTQFIGVWDQARRFIEYDRYPEADPQINAANQLLNNKGMLVETLIWSFPGAIDVDKSYLLPRPGVKLNIEKSVTGMPVGQKLRIIAGINDRADMVGRGPAGAFILQRVFPGENVPDYIGTTTSPEIRARRHAVREAVIATPQWSSRRLLSPEQLRRR